ncbi:MAG: hypothetical protein FJ044_01705 [Candidatus Cloacimonetes bacterium]|nr:hypothetical protein [Candidatus Cloacimonadota bacterium]
MGWIGNRLFYERNLRFAYDTFQEALWPQKFGGVAGLGKTVFFQGFNCEPWKNNGVIIHTGPYVGSEVGIVNGYTEIAIEKHDPRLVATGWKPAFAERGLKHSLSLSPDDIAALTKLCQEMRAGHCSEMYLLRKAEEVLDHALSRVLRSAWNNEQQKAVYQYVVQLYKEGIETRRVQIRSKDFASLAEHVRKGSVANDIAFGAEVVYLAGKHGMSVEDSEIVLRQYLSGLIKHYPMSWGETEVYHNGVINYTHYHFAHLRGQNFGTTEVKLDPVYDGGIDDVTASISTTTIRIYRRGRLQIEGSVWAGNGRRKLTKTKLTGWVLGELLEYLTHAVARDNFFHGRRPTSF